MRITLAFLTFTFAALGTPSASAQSTTRISVDSAEAQGNYPSKTSYGEAISADGRYIVFESNALNLVAGDTNGAFDIFVHDRLTSSTRRVSVSSSGAQANSGSGFPTISSDGRFVAFSSAADNLVNGDTNPREDVFVHELSTGMISLASKSSSGVLINASAYSPAGTFVKATLPCLGIALDVSPPHLGAMRTADVAGSVSVNFNAPPGVRGLTVQAVDAATCTPTNAVVL